jgi:hypothetical protein
MFLKKSPVQEEKMRLHEKKSNKLKWVLALVLLGVIVVLAVCDFMPEQQEIEKQIVHSVQ